ncbi:Uncharacterised protein [Zhongshania aliphaticivorans]|uniref:Methyltransferase domain-containing protein n=1 Tax=Zhongshania aliphaticivorans TaxID=1470434 RepID=A0A5S9QBA0_9GAMM|nr:methyltransferase domain-containing protein [Zhongshania aliphaticivorans]CAA0087518.1 Uncharacterised protein [Zhongshania aliphaticivorans]CAA0115033.1 Uncharacterised protein [Zhongshania aliphaticivorans]CAA0119845.1 Uncharacterised protein [Zhongshania aliphaticivorans]
MKSSDYDSEILSSWQKNAEPWTCAVRDGEIYSRVTVTDAAIIKAVMDASPKRVLDLGCGEGWLVRALADVNIDAVGMDGIPALIDNARALGGDFRQMSFQAFAMNGWSDEVDCAVFNFSLLGETIVADVLRVIPLILSTNGQCIIQTLHPAYVAEPYIDGWREGCWSGFSERFSEAAPWYFRTLSSWLSLFSDSRLQLIAMHEPINPETAKPASVIFVLKVKS